MVGIQVLLKDVVRMGALHLASALSVALEGLKLLIGHGDHPELLATVVLLESRDGATIQLNTSPKDVQVLSHVQISILLVD